MTVAIEAGDRHPARCLVCALPPDRRHAFECRLFATPGKRRAALAEEFGLSQGSMYAHRKWILRRLHAGADVGLPEDVVEMAFMEIPSDVDAAVQSAVGAWRVLRAQGEGPLAIEVFDHAVALTVTKETGGPYRRLISEILSGEVAGGDPRLRVARGALGHCLRKKTYRTCRPEVLGAFDDVEAAVHKVCVT